MVVGGIVWEVQTNSDQTNQIVLHDHQPNDLFSAATAVML
jgi:hypothetical protein